MTRTTNAAVGPGRHLRGAFAAPVAALLAAGFLLAGAASARHKNNPSPNSRDSGPRLTQDLTGSVPTHDGDHVRLSTDLGNVVVHTQETDEIAQAAVPLPDGVDLIEMLPH